MPSPIEQIKEKIDTVELVGSYIKLDKAGMNFKALCPFHSEKTPSFYVSPARQIWHCFGCNVGGDVFRFVMNIEGIEFPEALRILADKAGIELRREDPKLRSERTRILDLFEDATRFYEKNLYERKDVGAYLKERSLTGETAKSFRLGYAKNSWDDIISYLKEKGYSVGEVEKAGLAIRSQRDDSYYDRFRARIMFPLFDSAGRIVGFSGRIFERDVAPTRQAVETPISQTESSGSGGAKYINTPQTLLYDKSSLLYGFDRAKSEIRKKNAAIILEGQMDVILSHQAGVIYAVGVSGTALTPFHLRTLKRICDTLIMSFDPDGAGFEATTKSVDAALRTGFDIRVVPFSSAKDPADLIQENPQSWVELITKAEPIITFLLETLSKKHSDGRMLKKEVGRMVLPYVANISSELDRAHFVGEIAKVLTVREEVIWQELEKRKDHTIQKEAENEHLPRPAKDRRALLEERLTGLAIWKKSAFSEEILRSIPDWFSHERRSIFENALAREREAVPQDHYEKKLALETELLYGAQDDLSLEIDVLAKELHKEYIKEKLTKLTDEIRANEKIGKEQELDENLKEFKELSSTFNIL